MPLGMLTGRSQFFGTVFRVHCFLYPIDTLCQLAGRNIRPQHKVAVIKYPQNPTQ
ncbi:MAG: hypothetical protein ACYSN8_05585 [Planctomycetota bacterium]